MSCNRAFTDFISYSLEHMQDMKVALLRLQQSPFDIAIASTIPCTRKTINDMTSFYGCKHVIAFSYVFEGILSKVRDTELRAEADLIALLLSCCDHVSEMLNHLATSDEIYLGHLKRSAGLIRMLRAHHGYEKNMLLPPDAIHFHM